MGTLAHIARLVYSISLMFSRIAAIFREQKKQLYTSRFAEPPELKKFEADPKKAETSLLLGIGHFSQILRVKPTPKRRHLGNLLVVAPPRGGKSLLAISQLLTWPHSVIVNDIKGELFKYTGQYRSTLGKVIVVDPQGYGHRFDPLYGRHSEDELLSSASHLLFKPHEPENIFTERAVVMLTQLFLAARAEGMPPLPYVRQAIRSGTKNAARRLFEISPELATQFLDVEYDEEDEAIFKDKFFLSCYGTMSARMRRILTANVVKCFTGSDFTAEEIMAGKEPVTVYLNWPERHLLAIQPLVKLLWDTLIGELNAVYDAYDKEGKAKQCRPVLLLVDEGGACPIPELQKHSATVNGRGISLVIAVQAISQLDEVYGQYNRRTILNNMHAQIYYRQADYETAKYLQMRLGGKSEYGSSYSEHNGIETGTAKTEREVPLLTAQYIMDEMPDEEIICFFQGSRPFLARRMDWRLFPTLTKRWSETPPPVSPLPPPDMQPPTVLWQKRHTRAVSINPDSMN